MEFILYVLVIFCTLWVIYQVWAVNTKLSTGGKLIWTIFALFFSVITAVVYYFIGRK